MAKRPLFLPLEAPRAGVREMDIEFAWVPGMARVQKQRCIRAMHEAADARGIASILEISSKSETALGVQLSAFNLCFSAPGSQGRFSVESAFQASKVFQHGGPFTDLLHRPSREAKKDIRLRESGSLVAFSFQGQRFPLEPRTLFYDWLYIQALSQHPRFCEEVIKYQGFTDIEFNPGKSINCQAHSAALYVSLANSGLLDEALASPEAFGQILSEGYREKDSLIQVQGTLI